MNSFLADTSRPEVDRRLWMETNNKMGAKAEKTIKGQEKAVTIINLNDFVLLIDIQHVLQNFFKQK